MNFLRYACAAALMVGCGGGGGGEQQAAKTADDAPTEEHQNRGAPSVSAEIGGLNADEVKAIFDGSKGGLTQCMQKGAKRVEFLGGDVEFFLKIDTEGKVAHAHVKRSTIGDRATEKCMLGVLRGKSWPKPVGGEMGIAQGGIGFDMLNDVREPTSWSSDDAAPGLEKISSRLSACKHGKSGFEATMYVDTDGKVLSAGVAPPDEDGEESVDCIVEALEGGTFPSPGSWPAKVTLSL
jgi:hypothetical protein